MLPNALFWNIHMYGIMIAVGLLAAFLILYTYGKKLKITPRLLDFVYYDAIVSIILGFGCAAVMQAFYNYLDDPSQGFRLGSGITFMGGMVGGTLLFFLFWRLFRKFRGGAHFSEVISLIPCCILIAHGFGRIGCFFAGCCYGKETDFFLAVKFPNLPAPVHPTQLYEAAFLFLMFAVCTFLLFRFRFRHNMSLYLISYGIFRFLIEFLRGDPRGKLFGSISPSQFWSVLIVIFGVALIFIMKRVFAYRDAQALAAASDPACEETDADMQTEPEAGTESALPTQESSEDEGEEEEEDTDSL